MFVGEEYQHRWKTLLILKKRKTKNSAAPWGLIIIVYPLIILVGLWSLIYSLTNIYYSQKTRNWYKLVAEIKSVNFSYDENFVDPEGKLKIKYEYSINNRKYKSEKIGFGLDNTVEHDKIFLKLQNAKSVHAYVNPNNNSESVIIRGINSSILRVLIFSIMWNSMLSIFIMPFLFKVPFFADRLTKYNLLKHMVLVLIIWFVGVVLFLTKSTEVEIENKIEIIELASI